jgi:hypothetical protein
VGKLARYQEPLATASGLAVLVLWARAFAMQQANYNYSDSFGPTLLALGQFTTVPDSAVSLFYNGAPTLLPSAMAAVCRLFGVTPEQVHAFISSGTLVAALGALGYAARRMAGTNWAAALAMIAVPFSWPFGLAIGYSGPFWTGVPAAGYWGVGWACAVWGIWLAGPAGGMAALIPFVLTGVVVLAHPTWGLILLSVLAAGEMLGVAAADARAKALGAASVRVLVALLVASPQLVLIVSNVGQAVTPADVAGWWPLIQFRKSFHFYIWDGIGPYARLAKLAVLTVLSAAVVWPRLDSVMRRRLVATATTIAAITVFAYVVMEVLQSRTLSALVLTRALQLLAAACVISIAAAAVSAANDGGDWTRRIALWIAYLAVAVPVQTPFYSAAGAEFTEWLPVTFRAMGNDNLSFALAAPALLVAIIRGRAPRTTGLQRPALGAGVVLAAFACVGVLTAAKLPMIPAFHGAVVPTSTWNDLTTFVREQTPSDALIVTPPYPYSVASARRPFVLDYAFLGAAVYNPSMTAFELRALREIYGVTLDGLSHDEINGLLSKNDGILCLLERRYRALIASESKVRDLKRAFPSAAFLVGFKPGVTPLEWVCGAHDAPVLPLPVAYQNSDYVLYDLRTLPSARHTEAVH